MTNIRAVVVIGFPEGQVDQVVDQEVDAEKKNQQCRKSLLVHRRQVESYTHAVENGNHEVSFLYFTRF